MKTTPASSIITITKSTIPLAVILYVLLTIANFLRYIPDGILARTMGMGNSYRTDVMALFGDSQQMVFLLSVACAALIASAAHISDSFLKR